ncbi:NlpC/P60 family protein [Oryzihumus leptocrescens]|uniref:C40 family peptidase n=1 Tax=Oryzihumus leptocrescens TaxID=297536 RepID=UPI0031D2C50B
MRREPLAPRREHLVLPRGLRAALVAGAGAGLLLGLVLPASADPVYPSARQVAQAKAATAAKAAQADAIQARLIASTAHLEQVRAGAEQVAEAANGATLLLAEKTQAAQATRTRAAAAAAVAQQASDKVGQLAAQAYMSSNGLGGLDALLSSRGPQDILDKAAGLSIVSDIRNRTLAEASASSVVAGVLQRQAAQAQAQQLAAAKAADAARRAAQSQATQAAAETARVQQEQATMLSQLATLRNTSLALERERQQGLEAQAQARAAAGARAAAQARAAAAAEAARRAAEQAKHHPSGGGSPGASTNGGSGGGSGNGGGGSSTPTPRVTDAPPPVSGGVSAVIAFARAQVGDPYEWGAAGPGTWDCSGLTMRAWAQAGVSLSHYTGAQWGETARVPLSDLRPGDLLFFGDSGPTSHHVGLYIGGDEMIEAPYTGAFVSIAKFWGRPDLLPYGGRP